MVSPLEPTRRRKGHAPACLAYGRGAPRGRKTSGTAPARRANKSATTVGEKGGATGREETRTKRDNGRRRRDSDAEIGLSRPER